jgi:hypothetical protein
MNVTDEQLEQFADMVIEKYRKMMRMSEIERPSSEMTSLERHIMNVQRELDMEDMVNGNHRDSDNKRKRHIKNTK